MEQNPNTQSEKSDQSEPSSAETSAENKSNIPGEVSSSHLEIALQESEKKYTYLYAEFENYKKRALKERAEMRQFGWEPVARELIGFVDNLRLGLSHAPSGTDPSFLEGMQMIYRQVVAMLEKHGIAPIEAVGKGFDPHLHEAVGQTPHESPEGTVIHEETQGFTFHGRLLRPSRVIVSTGAPQKSG